MADMMRNPGLSWDIVGNAYDSLFWVWLLVRAKCTQDFFRLSVVGQH